MNSRENRNARYNEGVNPANHTKADTAKNRRKRECRLPSSFSPVFPVTEAKKDRCIPLNASRWESPAVLNASDREGGVYSLEPESSARIRAPASPQENRRCLKGEGLKGQRLFFAGKQGDNRRGSEPERRTGPYGGAAPDSDSGGRRSAGTRRRASVLHLPPQESRNGLQQFFFKIPGDMVLFRLSGQ